jgi:stage II sporulation SpoAA-like protein
MFYSIQASTDSTLLRIALRGFWTIATFDAFTAESGRAIHAILARHGRFDMLSDCDDFPVQGPDVSAAFQQLRDSSQEASGNRMAVYTRSALGRIQAERLLGSPDCRIFESEAAALEWLAQAPSAT